MRASLPIDGVGKDLFTMRPEAKLSSASPFGVLAGVIQRGGGSLRLISCTLSAQRNGGVSET